MLDRLPRALLVPAVAVGDPQASRTVYGVVAVLVVVGVVFVWLAIWLLRYTRHDPALLAPLERMESRRWRRLGPQDRRRLLDEERPAGAVPLDRARSEPEVMSDFAAIRPVTGFDDLADPPADTSNEIIGDPLVIDTQLVDETDVLDLDDPDDSDVLDLDDFDDLDLDLDDLDAADIDDDLEEADIVHGDEDPPEVDVAQVDAIAAGDDDNVTSNDDTGEHSSDVEVFTSSTD